MFAFPVISADCVFLLYLHLTTGLWRRRLVLPEVRGEEDWEKYQEHHFLTNKVTSSILSSLQLDVQSCTTWERRWCHLHICRMLLWKWKKLAILWLKNRPRHEHWIQNNITTLSHLLPTEQFRLQTWLAGILIMKRGNTTTLPHWKSWTKRKAP